MSVADPVRPGSGPGHRVRVEPMTSEHGPAVIAIYQAGIDEGDATFETAGFRIVGTRERIGQRNGRWRDVLLLERRSPEF